MKCKCNIQSNSKQASEQASKQASKHFSYLFFSYVSPHTQFGPSFPFDANSNQTYGWDNLRQRIQAHSRAPVSFYLTMLAGVCWGALLTATATTRIERIESRAGARSVQRLAGAGAEVEVDGEMVTSWDGVHGLALCCCVSVVAFTYAIDRHFSSTAALARAIECLCQPELLDYNNNYNREREGGGGRRVRVSSAGVHVHFSSPLADTQNVPSPVARSPPALAPAPAAAAAAAAAMVGGAAGTGSLYGTPSAREARLRHAAARRAANLLTSCWLESHAQVKMRWWWPWWPRDTNKQIQIQIQIQYKNTTHGNFSCKLAASDSMT